MRVKNQYLTFNRYQKIWRIRCIDLYDNKNIFRRQLVLGVENKTLKRVLCHQYVVKSKN